MTGPGALLDALTRELVGRGDEALGLVLALVAREHALLEGPPGCGKAALAGALARLSGARALTLTLHRDLQPGEWRGDTILRRQRSGTRERVRAELAPGPLADAEILVVPGLTRAPAEALTPLLRALETRRLDARRLPLEVAVATAGPAGLESYGDELEPAARDRFGVQIRMTGLLGAADPGPARALLDRSCDAPVSPGPACATRGRRHAWQQAAAALPLEPGLREAWRELLVELRARLDPLDRARLGDRVLARAGPALMRAHALLRGADAVRRRDLVATRFALAGRVPAERADELLAAVVRGAGLALPVPAGSGAGTAAASAGAAPQDPAAPRPGAVRAAARSSAGVREPVAADVASLVRVLEGRLARGGAGRREHPAGAPRSRRRMRALDELLDADPLDAVLLVDGAELRPSVLRRERRAGRGAVALLRDVSASMEGGLARWAGEVVAGLVRGARRHGLRVGYVEFDHDAHVFRPGRALLHRRYGELLARAADARSSGRTNYEAPLRAALRGLSRAGRHGHVVLITDGVPVVGDPAVRAERALARRLGVRVHTVFVGLGEPPPVLEGLARVTGGVAFRGRPQASGMRVEAR